MAPKWIGFLIFVWVIAAIVGSISEGGNLLAYGNTAYGDNTTDPVQGIMSYAQSVSKMSWGYMVNPINHFSFFGNVFRVMILDFDIWKTGPWAILRWIILAPIIGTVVYGIIVSFWGVFQRQV